MRTPVFLLALLLPAAPARADFAVLDAHWLRPGEIAIPGGGQGWELVAAPSGDWDEGERTRWALEPAGRVGGAGHERWPHLRGLPLYRPVDLGDDALRALLRQPHGLARGSATRGLQLPWLLDALYTTGAPLGPTWAQGQPSLALWAPTARAVELLLYRDGPAAAPEVLPMQRQPDGRWAIDGGPGWKDLPYRFAVQVYVPSAGRVVRNEVTDPYSRGLTRNSTHSLLVDLDDPALAPPGWGELELPALASPADAVVYELHVRDFSASDPTVPEAARGTYGAFALDSAGSRHLRRLAGAGLTHLHLLPVFDIASIDEDPATWPAPPDLAGLPPDGEQQQARLAPLRPVDPYNWGYDPWHFGVPEGSYSRAVDGRERIREFRAMVQALAAMGLRTVMDVVYNHTHASGQAPQSVLDRIVPGYYHRLDERGQVHTSTCCQNTATEHAMFRRLVRDDLLHWARDYRIAGFRFDLMGHHMVADMVEFRDALRAQDPDILLYGEGWDFGEVGGGARGPNATQGNLAGTGIATFNDRIRDAIRGGNPFGDRREQGFASGLYTAPNGFQRAGSAERARLLEHADRIRVGLAGNLAGYRFVDRNGRATRGDQLGYGGYTASPLEAVNYASAHDNETLFDKLAWASDPALPLEELAKAQVLALATVALGQGLPFFHAGGELLRSKSLDGDSYDSGDWFNRLDWGTGHNNFGVGLPPAHKNRDRWTSQRPVLARADQLRAGPDAMGAVADRFVEYLAVRAGSPLFRLSTGGQVQQRLRFHNTGPDQKPGLIVFSLDGSGDGPADPRYERIFVLLNAAPGEQFFRHPAMARLELEPHPALSRNPGRHEPGESKLVVEGRSAAVFVQRR